MDTRGKILIAYDGSASADAAIYDLHRAGLPREVEAIVFSVAEAWLPPPPPSSYEIVETVFAEDSTTDAEKVYEGESGALADAQVLATEAAKRILSKFPDWDVRAEAQFGSPASELLAKADEWEPDLIVVGSHGRSAIGRLFLGSVSHKVVTEARCSVRIARGQISKKDAPIRIVVGVDGSPDAEEALRSAAMRAWPVGSEVRIVAAFDTLTPTMAGSLIPPVVQWAEEQNRAAVEIVRKMVESFEEQFRAAKLNVSSIVKPGDPKRVLVEEAEAWEADCIFVGARGLSRIDRFLLGSVSAAVAGRAHCSVEVVRPKAKPDARPRTS
ncbi:MAG TPA: universal stress protein [Blastocatellia bacterium]|nr:universal stress protein [Blastocatellia bacterium]